MGNTLEKGEKSCFYHSVAGLLRRGRESDSWEGSCKVVWI